MSSSSRGNHHHTQKVSIYLYRCIAFAVLAFYDGLYSYLTANLCVKVEAKSIDQKPNTPRSKHSATEQRRRSKINDRHA